MQMIGRDYFDMKTKIDIREYNLDLINGFATSIANYENRLLLCAEITHKLLHKSTVHDIMNKIFHENGGFSEGFKAKCTAEIVGRVIMTK
jgi:aubergine-like protein